MICIIGKSDMHNYLLVNQKENNSKLYVTFPFIFTLRHSHITTNVLNIDSTQGSGFILQAVGFHIIL